MTNENQFTVRFWGVRGSYPVAGQGTLRYGGNTSCVEVRAGNQIIIFDAGTGIIPLGQALAREFGAASQPVAVQLFFSHLHHDHTQGLPFFAPAYLPTSQINFFLPNMYEADPQPILESVMAPPNFPVPFYRLNARKQIFTVAETQQVVLGPQPVDAQVNDVFKTVSDSEVSVQLMQSYGHPQGVMAYRITYQGKSLVYATDTEGYVNGDRRMVAFAQNADLLIHDAQYTDDHYIGELAGVPVTQGYGHSTAAMACETARSAGVGQLVLFHHDPNYDDIAISKIEQQARLKFPNTLAAREGQVIQLKRSRQPARIAEIAAQFQPPRPRFGQDSTGLLAHAALEELGKKRL